MDACCDVRKRAGRSRVVPPCRGATLPKATVLTVMVDVCLFLKRRDHFFFFFLENFDTIGGGG